MSSPLKRVLAGLAAVAASAALATPAHAVTPSDSKWAGASAVTAGQQWTPSLSGKAALRQGTRPCPAYYYCFYQHGKYNGWNGSSYTSPGWKLQYQTTTFGDFSNPPYSGVNALNQLSSIINNTNKRICVYDAVGGQHRVIINVAPYQDYLNVPSEFNDRADYWRVVSGSASCP